MSGMITLNFVKDKTKFLSSCIKDLHEEDERRRNDTTKDYQPPTPPDAVLIGSEGQKIFTHRVHMELCKNLMRHIPEYLQDDEKIEFIFPDWPVKYLNALSIFMRVGAAFFPSFEELKEFELLLKEVGLPNATLSVCKITKTDKDDEEVKIDELEDIHLQTQARYETKEKSGQLLLQESKPAKEAVPMLKFPVCQDDDLELKEADRITKFSCDFCQKEYKLSKQLKEHQKRCQKKQKAEISMSPRSRNTKKEIQRKCVDCKHCKAIYNIPMDMKLSQIAEHACTGTDFINLEINEHPSFTAKVTLACTLCFGPNKPVMTCVKDLKLHYLFGHCNSFFRINLKEPFECPYCSSEEFDSSSWSLVLQHIGIYHGKLFQALKHLKKQDMTNVLKKLYPEKLKKWKKNRLMTNKRARSSSNDSRSTTESHTSYEDREVPKVIRNRRRNASNTSTDSSSVDIPRQFTGKKLAPNGNIICTICPDGDVAFAKDFYFRDHLAHKHFFNYIAQRYPRDEVKTKTIEGVPRIMCSFPGCEDVFFNDQARIKHIGNVHKEIEVALSSRKLVKEAKKEAIKGTKKPDRKRTKAPSASSSRTTRPRSSSSERSQRSGDDLTCRRCGVKQATRESLRLHDCQSSFVSNEGVRPRSSISYYEGSDEDEPRPAKAIKPAQAAPAAQGAKEQEEGSSGKSGGPTPMENTEITLSVVLDNERDTDDLEDDDENEEEDGEDTDKMMEERAGPSGLITPTSLSWSPDQHTAETSDDDDTDIDTLLKPHELLDDDVDSGTMKNSSENLSDDPSTATNEDDSIKCENCEKTFKSFRKLKVHKQCKNCKQNCVLDFHHTCEKCGSCYDKVEEVFHEFCDVYECNVPCFTNSEEFQDHVSKHDYSEFS